MASENPFKVGDEIEFVEERPYTFLKKGDRLLVNAADKDLVYYYVPLDLLARDTEPGLYTKTIPSCGRHWRFKKVEKKPTVFKPGDKVKIKDVDAFYRIFYGERVGGEKQFFRLEPGHVLTLCEPAQNIVVSVLRPEKLVFFNLPEVKHPNGYTFGISDQYVEPWLPGDPVPNVTWFGKDTSEKEKKETVTEKIEAGDTVEFIGSTYRSEADDILRTGVGDRFKKVGPIETSPVEPPKPTEAEVFAPSEGDVAPVTEIKSEDGFRGPKFEPGDLVVAIEDSPGNDLKKGDRFTVASCATVHHEKAYLVFMKATPGGFFSYRFKKVVEPARVKETPPEPSTPEPATETKTVVTESNDLSGFQVGDELAFIGPDQFRVFDEDAFLNNGDRVVVVSLGLKTISGDILLLLVVKNLKTGGTTRASHTRFKKVPKTVVQEPIPKTPTRFLAFKAYAYTVVAGIVIDDLIKIFG